MNNLQRLLTSIGAGLLVVSILLFAIYRSKDFVEGPTITFLSPPDYGTVAEALVTITGRVTNADEVSLNGRKIFLSESEEFSERLLLAPGLAIIEIHASNRYQKEKKAELKLFYKP